MRLKDGRRLRRLIAGELEIGLGLAQSPMPEIFGQEGGGELDRDPSLGGGRERLEGEGVAKAVDACAPPVLAPSLPVEAVPLPGLAEGVGHYAVCKRARRVLPGEEETGGGSPDSDESHVLPQDVRHLRVEGDEPLPFRLRLPERDDAGAKVDVAHADGDRLVEAHPAALEEP